jgi:hypothetical protein
MTTPKPVQDLPCATNPAGPQPSNPTPIYQPAAKVPLPTTPPPSASYNPAPTVASLTNDLSQATLTISAASRALGFTGPARDFLAFAVRIAAELKILRSKK